MSACNREADLPRAPAAGGTISRKQLPERIALTWLNVPEYQTTNQNSLQIELYFDGRIRVTQLAVAAADGICGLSRGTGLSPLYVEVNLSGAEVCGNSNPRAGSSVTLR